MAGQPGLRECGGYSSGHNGGLTSNVPAESAPSVEPEGKDYPGFSLQLLALCAISYWCS